MFLSAQQILCAKKKEKKKLENAMNYSVTFCNLKFAQTLVGIKSMDWTIRAIKCKDVLKFLCKTKCPFVVCIICVICATQ